MNRVPWFRGVYDKVLSKTIHWARNWERGIPFKDELLQININAEKGVVPITTVRRCKVAWLDGELSIIKNIIRDVHGDKDPTWNRLWDMLALAQNMEQNGQLTISGARIVPMDFRKGDVIALIEVMTEAKNNRKKDSIESIMNARVEGKGLWEK